MQNETDLAFIRALYGRPMEVFSNLLRLMIKAAPGKMLYSADYAAIEARVLFWLAGHAEGVKAFAENRPIYEEMAAVIFKVALEMVTKEQRQLGKQAILGSGFGMGWKKFIETCANYDMVVSEELARTAINAYRDLHKPVPKLWAMIEKASIYATTHPGKRVTVNKTKWFIEGDYLFCELPSGRRLAYYGPKIRPHKTSWGETKASLHHWGVDPKTKQWVFGPTYGGKLVENIVQATARDLMAAAMLEIEKAGYEIILSVHDEVVAEKTNGDLKEFETIMSTIPAWANGLPVKVSGWEGERYRKG